MGIGLFSVIQLQCGLQQPIRAIYYSIGKNLRAYLSFEERLDHLSCSSRDIGILFSCFISGTFRLSSQEMDDIDEDSDTRADHAGHGVGCGNGNTCDYKNETFP
jgi:hypothetical protein